MRGEVLFNRKQYDEARADYLRLQEKATTPERRRLGQTGALRCSYLLQDHPGTVSAATALLGGSNLTPELRTEALYDRAKAYIAQSDWQAATPDLRQLAADTRTLQGAEAKYLLAPARLLAGPHLHPPVRRLCRAGQEARRPPVPPQPAAELPGGR